MSPIAGVGIRCCFGRAQRLLSAPSRKLTTHGPTPIGDPMANEREQAVEILWDVAERLEAISSGLSGKSPLRIEIVKLRTAIRIVSEEGKP